MGAIAIHRPFGPELRNAGHPVRAHANHRLYRVHRHARLESLKDEHVLRSYEQSVKQRGHLASHHPGWWRAVGRVPPRPSYRLQPFAFLPRFPEFTSFTIALMSFIEPPTMVRI